MCGSFVKKVLDPIGLNTRWDDPPDTPDTAAVDPEAERKKAENEAAAAANAKVAEQSRQRRANSLLSSGGGGQTQQAQTSSVLAYGKNKLGE
jgi:hypothetical protein